ncbi:MAG TPA: hypothetical protein ENJ37_05780 [Deltaproteobacteria bacterium]|nr:hypothetical protein [Deltaproteobacteria bacterium]
MMKKRLAALLAVVGVLLGLAGQAWALSIGANVTAQTGTGGTVTDSKSGPPPSTVKASVVSLSPSDSALTSAVATTAGDLSTAVYAGGFGRGSWINNINNESYSAQAVSTWSLGISNTTAGAKAYTLDLSIVDGFLNTRRISGAVPGDFATASISLEVTLDSSVVWSNTTTLHQIYPSTAPPTLTAAGTSTTPFGGGSLSLVDSGSTYSEWEYEWSPFTLSIPLGTLAPGGSSTVGYTLTASVSGSIHNSSSDASSDALLGDPPQLYSTGGGGPFYGTGVGVSITSSPAAVPEPSTLLLTGAAVFLGLTAAGRLGRSA